MLILQAPIFNDAVKFYTRLTTVSFMVQHNGLVNFILRQMYESTLRLTANEKFIIHVGSGRTFAYIMDKSLIIKIAVTC